MPNEPDDLLQPEPTDEVIPLEELNPDLKKWPETDKPAPAPPPPSKPRQIDVELSVSELTKNGPVVISGGMLPNEPNSPRTAAVEPLNNTVATPLNPGQAPQSTPAKRPAEQE
jgi:hypothetical protein